MHPEIEWQNILRWFEETVYRHYAYLYEIVLPRIWPVRPNRNGTENVVVQMPKVGFNEGFVSHSGSLS